MKTVLFFLCPFYLLHLSCGLAELPSQTSAVYLLPSFHPPLCHPGPGSSLTQISNHSLLAGILVPLAAAFHSLVHYINK